MRDARSTVGRLLMVGLFVAASLWGAASASADVMPACEEGQHLETNPVGPDETHHAGGQCVGEPTGCTVGVGAGSRGGLALPSGLMVLAAVALSVRRRCI